MSEGFFQTLSDKFKLKYNETIKLLLFTSWLENQMKMQKSGWTD